MIPWQLVVLHPFGLFLLLSSSLFFFLLVFIVWKTPAMAFLKASILRRTILINPLENRRLDIKTSKMYGSLAHVKSKGYYIIDPNDVFIEGKSKTPVAIVYGNFGISINPEMSKLAQRLQEMGIRNYPELMNAMVEEVPAKEAYRRGLISRKEYEENKDKMYTVPREMGEIKIMGESVPVHNVVDYFARDERADFIESEIQRRTAAQTMAKLSKTGDLFKWAVILAVILIAGALAYNIIMQGRGEQAQHVGGLVGAGARIITQNATGTALH